MKRHRSSGDSARDVDAAFDAAVDVLSPDAMRAFLKAWRHGHADGGDFAEAVITLAARSTLTWSVPAEDAALIAEAREIIDSAVHVSMADPSDLNDLFARAGRCFLARDYATARGVYEIVIEPLANAEIDLGQDELYEEVLSDLSEVGTRYLVSVYETTPLDDRPRALLEALALLDAIATPWTPLADMKKAATRPLSDFDSFAPLWAAYLRAHERELGEFQAKRVLLEAIEHAAGTKGLEQIARESKSYESYLAWCGAVSRERDDVSTYAALREAASSCAKHHAAAFHDVAAVAAVRAGNTRASREHLADALRAEPTVRRLCRLLLEDDDATATTIRARAKKLLTAENSRVPRLAALLELVIGDRTAAAARMLNAPGLGWSSDTHPGHVAFPALLILLGGVPPPKSVRYAVSTPMITHDVPGAEWAMRIHDSAQMLAERMGMKLSPGPPLAELLKRCAPASIPAKERDLLLLSLRATAERRIDGVTSEKRRRHYEHAALLAVAVAELEVVLGTRSDWLRRIRSETTRWPALQSEFQTAVAQSAPRVA